MFYKCGGCGKFVAKGIKLCDVCEGITTEENQVKLELNGNSGTGTIISKNTPKTLDEMISLFDIDTSVWFSERVVTNSWDVTNKDGKVFTNYQTKIFFKRNQVAWSFNEIKEDFINAVKDHTPIYKPIKYNFNKQKENNLLEINIADLHIGKLAWHGETNENYDTKIACERFITALETTITRASVFDFNRIVFPIGNDFFNADDSNNLTSNGTPQDADVRWQKYYRAGRKLLIEGIDYLKQFAPVDVVIVAGNHDQQRMFYVGDTLETWYENCTDVNVNNSAHLRKYYTFGKVLLGFTHGNNEKQADLPLIMAQEKPEEWSNSKFREFHLGHLHHRREIKYLSTQEYKGVVVRLMRSLTGADAWHYSKGFVGSIKGSESFIWNDNTGLIAMMENNLTI